MKALTTVLTPQILTSVGEVLKKDSLLAHRDYAFSRFD